MASESYSTSSSSSGDDFVPIFFLLRKVMKSLRRSYDKKRGTIRWMKQTQLQLKLSPVKMKAIQTWTCVRLLLQWGTHSGVSVESVSASDRRQDYVCCLIMSSAWRKFTQRRTTAHRSTTVAVDLPLFARIFLQLLVLDGAERLFGHDHGFVTVFLNLFVYARRKVPCYGFIISTCKKVTVRQSRPGRVKHRL